jgi:hypothetical protein
MVIAGAFLPIQQCIGDPMHGVRISPEPLLRKPACFGKRVTAYRLWEGRQQFPYLPEVAFQGFPPPWLRKDQFSACTRKQDRELLRVITDLCSSSSEAVRRPPLDLDERDPHTDCSQHDCMTSLVEGECAVVGIEVEGITAG